MSVINPHISTEKRGVLGLLTLTRPAALNALDLGMVEVLATALEAWAADDGIAVVAIRGEGPRAFCAGGDIRAWVTAGRDTALAFLRAEYRLNYRIATYPKPFVALMHGVTMGGGAGLSVHARHRLADPGLVLAMPETAIGFVPDVGGTWLLAHAPGEIGTYLALTGEAIGPADAIYAGLADVQIPLAGIPALIGELTQLTPGTGNAAIHTLLAKHVVQPETARLAGHRALIDQCFAGSSVEAILQALEADGTPFALKTRDLIASKSPTSLKLTFRLIRLLFLIFLTLWIAFFLLGFGALLGYPALHTAGGWVGLVCGALALYGSFALVANITFGREVVPVGTR